MSNQAFDHFKYFDLFGGGWRALVCVNRQRKTKVFSSKAEAELWAAHTTAQMHRAPEEIASTRRFGDLLKHRHEHYGPKRSQQRWETNKINFYLSDLISKVVLAELSGKGVAEWRDRRLKDVKAGTILRNWNFLGAICTVAVRELKWLKDNPFREPRRPCTPLARKRIISQSETAALLDHLPARIGAVVLCAICNRNRNAGGRDMRTDVGKCRPGQAHRSPAHNQKRYRASRF
ncbi:MAG: hypothetical protein ACK5NY_04890 [Burkholderiaceae bacterium]